MRINLKMKTLVRKGCNNLKEIGGWRDSMRGKRIGKWGDRERKGESQPHASDRSFALSRPLFKLWQSHTDYSCICQESLMSVSEFSKIIQKNTNKVCIMSSIKTWASSIHQLEGWHHIPLACFGFDFLSGF